MSMPFIGAAAALFVAVMPLAANATLIVYTNQADFLAAISNPATDTFNDVARNVQTPSPLIRTVGSYSYSASAEPNNFYAVGSAADVWLSPNTYTTPITFYAFSSSVFGVGGFFFNTDVDGVPESLSVTVSALDADGSVNATLLNTTPTEFVGFVSTSGMTQVRVAANQPTQGFTWPTVNDLVLGGQLQSVPEPGTLALLGLGLAGLAARRERKQ
jgi:hypothetical protein